jgi:hypothetical protein
MGDIEIGARDFAASYINSEFLFIRIYFFECKGLNDYGRRRWYDPK